jgi:hypothetical protein
MEEVRGQDGLGLTGQELTPGLPGSPGRGVDARIREDLPNRRRRDLWVPITLSQPLAWYLLLNEALSKWVSGGERA